MNVSSSLARRVAYGVIQGRAECKGGTSSVVLSVTTARTLALRSLVFATGGGGRL